MFWPAARRLLQPHWLSRPRLEPSRAVPQWRLHSTPGGKHLCWVQGRVIGTPFAGDCVGNYFFQQMVGHTRMVERFSMHESMRILWLSSLVWARTTWSLASSFASQTESRRRVVVAGTVRWDTQCGMARWSSI